MKYTIQNNELTAQFNSLGGEMTSVKDKAGTEYVWVGDAKYWGSQAPILFPIVGSLRDKKAIIGGDKSCFMERHGVVRKLEFEVTETREDSITFCVGASDETRERYPYDFKLFVKYTLQGKSLITEYTVVNNNQVVLPFQIGAHPGFNCPLFSGERFEDYVVEFEQAETADCPASVPATGLVDMEDKTRLLTNEKALRMNHDLFRVDCLVFDKLKSRQAKLYNPQTGRGLKMSFEDFDTVIVWSSKNDGPFVALEPWKGLSTCSDEGDVFEKKRGVTLLPAGESKSFAFTISIL